MTIEITEKRYENLKRLETQDARAAEKFSNKLQGEIDHWNFLKILPERKDRFKKEDFGIDYVGDDLKGLWMSTKYIGMYPLFYPFLRKEIFKPNTSILVGNNGWLPEMKRSDIAKIERYGVTLFLPYTMSHNFKIFCSPQDSCYAYLFEIVDCLFDWYK